MRAERPIVSRPDRQTLAQHLTSRSIATIAWGLWIYLWLPVLSAAFWLLGLHITYRSIVRAPNKSSLLILFLLVLMCNIVVSSWASYNYIRFVGKTRRRGGSPITHEAVGNFFGMTDPETLTLLLNERQISLYFVGAALDRAEVFVPQEQENKDRENEAEATPSAEPLVV